MVEDVFPGSARLPDGTARGSAVFELASGRQEPPRFVDGFEPFAAFLAEHRESPSRMAADLRALLSFIAEHAEVRQSPELLRSAALFTGNAVAVLHPAASWRVTSEPEIGTTTRSIPVVGLVEAMIEEPARVQPFVDSLATWAEDDRDDQERREAMTEGQDRVLVLPPEPFERPLLPSPTYYDADGHVIEYGSRWRERPAPEEAYERISNPDRFAPLLLDVDALVDYLCTWYETSASRRRTTDGAEAVQLTPSTGAAVTVTASVEGVHVTAGALFAEWMPDCSCDACDENAEGEAERLERTLLGIAGGGLRERYPLGRQRWQQIQLLAPDGSSTSSSGGIDPRLTVEQTANAQALIDRLDDGWWPAWTLRGQSAASHRGVVAGS